MLSSTFIKFSNTHQFFKVDTVGQISIRTAIEKVNFKKFVHIGISDCIKILKLYQCKVLMNSDISIHLYKFIEIHFF